MSLDKDFRVSIYRHEALLCTYELHTEFEDGECVDVSSTHTSGEPFDDPLEDEAIDLILESGLDSGVGIVQGFKIEWILINKVLDD